MRTTWVATATITLCLSLAGLPAAAQAPADSGTFRPTGAPAESRAFHTATLLPDGRVLVVGGVDWADWASGPLPTAEVWDPTTETFSPAGLLPEARAWHTATLLPDGRVLVVGGEGSGVGGPVALASAEVWDPVTGTFTPTGSPAEARGGHTATLVDDGRVLVVGGDGDDGAVAGAEVWDPATGLWEPAGSLSVVRDIESLTRSMHTAMPLADGRVLLIGRWDYEGPLSTAEIWDPATATFTPVDTTFAPPEMHTATLLADGDVLFIDDTGRYGESLPARIWDPETGAMTPTGSLAAEWGGHIATLLDDGRVLVIGGWNVAFEEVAPGSAEIWDPATGTFSPAGSLTEFIQFPTVTALPDGRALVLGTAEPEYNEFASFAGIWEPGDGA